MSSRSDNPSTAATEAPRLTPKQRQTGLARLKDASASEYKVAVRGGYSRWTARKPAESGIDSLAFAHQLAVEDGIKPTVAGRLGLGTLAELASDQDQPGGVRGAAAKELLAYSTATDGAEGQSAPAAIELAGRLQDAGKMLRVLVIVGADERHVQRLLRHLRRWTEEYHQLDPRGGYGPLDRCHALLQRLLPDDNSWWLSAAGREELVQRERRAALAPAQDNALDAEVIE